MEGDQRKLYYFFLFGIALLSAVLLTTVMAPEKKPVEREKKTRSTRTGGEKDTTGDGTAKDDGAKKNEVKKNEVKKNEVKKNEVKKNEEKKRTKKADQRTRAERARQARERLRQQKTASIETDHYLATVSNLNAGVTSFTIKGDRYRDKDGDSVEVISTDKERYYPLGMELKDVETGEPVLGPDVFFEVEQLSRSVLRLSAEGDGIGVARRLEAGTGPYQLWVTTTVTNRADGPRRLAYSIAAHHYIERENEQTPVPLLAVPSAEVSNGLCYYNVKVKSAEGKSSSESAMERHDREDLLTPRLFKGSVTFVGVENVYFLKAIAPHPFKGQPGAGSCRLHTVDYVKMPGGAIRVFKKKSEAGTELGSLFSARLLYPKIVLGPGQARTFRSVAYLGPKMPDDLAKAGHGLTNAIDFGWFAVLSEALSWLLRIIHSGVGNWGVAIILLTMLVKVVLYPLTAKSFNSMARMRMLKPEMDRINEMYKDDREKKGAATMELYRKHKINPLGGCLPQLLQFPIWIALYTSLRTNVELYHAPFALWWTDLSSPDPFYVLPLALGILMFVQQKMTPTAMDPVQAKMMLYMMPTMIKGFMLFLPAGLCLYILTNSVLSIGQQRLIEHRLKQAEQSGESAKGQAPPGDEVKEEAKEDSANSSARKEPRIKKSKQSKSQRRSRSGRRKKTA